MQVSTDQNSQTPSIEQILEMLFSKMAAIIPSMINMPNKEDYLAMLAEMMIESGIGSMEQIEKGLANMKVYSGGCQFAPPPAQFVNWCLPTAEELGLPDPQTAYEDASGGHWSHPAIFEAAKRVGTGFMRTGRSEKTRPAFLKAYEDECEAVRLGKVYPEPQTDNLIHHEKEMSEADKARIEESKVWLRERGFKI